MASDYQPVSCSFYDELGPAHDAGAGLYARGGGRGRPQTVEAVIKDVYTEGDAEYVRLDDGRRIRLDLIQQVDNVTRPGAC